MSGGGKGSRTRGGKPSRRLVLEPRMMFDAAAVTTAATLADDHADAAPATAHRDAGADASRDAAPDHAAPAALAQVPAPEAPRAILFVDAGVPGRDMLTSGLAPDVELVVLDPSRDGLAQITATLAGRDGVQSVHIVSHGEPGALVLGSTRVSQSVLTANADAIAGWRDALSDGADILLYGCDVGAGEAGAAFVAQLADLTGTDVAASTDATGAAALGGDWVLELKSGAVESDLALSSAAIEAYDRLLAPQPAGGDATVTTTAGGALSITEDTGTPTDIRLTVPSRGAAVEVRILAVTGGTLTRGDGSAITLGANGTTLPLTGAGTNLLDLKFTPDANRDTAATFTYVLVDPADNAAANNSPASTATISITAVNDAPTHDGAGTVLDVAEDTAAPAGTSVADLLATLTVVDTDTGAQGGIAITGADLANGVWQYSTNSGGSWQAIGLRDDTTALLLSSDAANRVRFVPAADHNGTATLTVRAWDRTAGTSGSTHPITATGGDKAFSAATATVTQTVTPVNDRPTLDTGYTVRLAPTDEDTTPTFTVASLIAGLTANAALKDPDGTTAFGIAVTATGTSGTLSGTWEYRLDGGSPWTALGAVSTAAARLLPAAAELRYIPAADTGGEATLTFHAWDQESGTGTLDTTTGTGTSPFTAATATLSQPVTPVNDAPVIVTAAATLTERQTLTLTAAQLGITDVDSTSEQLVVRLESLPANMEITRLFGGVDVPLAVGGLFSMADLAGGQIKLRYTGAELTADASRSFTYTVRDGAGGELANQTFAITVKDVNAQVSVTSTSLTATEYLAPGDFTTITLTSSDADGNAALTTYTVKSLPSATVGKLVFDVGGTGTYTDVTVGQTFTQAQATAGRLRFVGTGAEPTGGNASASFTVDVTDGHTVLAPTTQANVAVTIAISPRNDDPSVVRNVAATVTEGGEVVITDETHLDHADPDSARNQLTYTISTAPTRGVLYLNSVRLGAGSAFQQIDIDAGRLKYVHDGVDPVTASDSFGYTLRDGSGAALPGTFTINVTPVDDAPTLRTRTVYINAANLGTDTATVTAGNLQGEDVDTAAGALVYDISAASLPPNTQFHKGGSPVLTFTQADINAGLVTLVHTGDLDFGNYTVNLTLKDATTTVNGTLTVSLTIGGGGPGNEDPTLKVNRPLVTAEGSGGTVIGTTLLQSTDPEQGAAALTYTIGTAPGHGDLYLGATKLTAGGTFTQDDLDKGQVSFTHDGTEPVGAAAGTTFTFTVTDGAGGSTGTKTFTIDFTPVNDAPTLVANGGLAVSEHDTDATDDGDAATLADQANAVLLNTGLLGSNLLQYADPDTTDPQQLVYVLVSTPGGGTVSRLTGSTWEALGVGGRFSVDEVQSGKVAYFHNPDSEPDAAADQFQVRLTDGGTLGGGGEATSGTVTINVTVAPVNDAPQASGGGFTLAEGGTHVLTTGQLGASDSDNATSALTYRLTQLPTRGTVEIDAGGGFAAVTAGQLGTAAAEFTQAMITGGKLRYIHDGTENFTDSLKFAVKDPGGLDSGAATVTVTIRPDNDAPTITVNTGIGPTQGYEGEVTTITAALLDVDDTDNTGTQVQLRITQATTVGKLFIDNGGNEVTLGVGSVFTETQLKAGLLKYRHDGNEIHADSFKFTVSDGSGDGEPTGTFAITVGAVNDSPVLTVPTAKTVDEDASLAITGISIADVDVASATMTATLTVLQGTLTVNTGVPGGVTGGQVGNNGTATVTVTGTRAEINATLAHATGLTYAGTAEYNGADTLTVTVSDGGTGQGRDPGDGGNPAILNTKNSGDTTSQQDSKTVAITVRALNDAPSATYNGGNLTGGGAATVDEDTTLSLSDITVFDPDINRNETNGTNDGLMQVTLAATSGQVWLASAAGVTGTALTTPAASIVVTGTKAALDAALSGGNVKFKGAQDYNGAASVAITVSDLANEGSGGAKTVAGTVNVTVTAVNDAPTVTLPATLTVNEDAAFTFSGADKIVLADPDSGGNLEVALSLIQAAGVGPSDANGTLKLVTTTGVTFVSGANESNAFTIKGTVTDLNAALATMQFHRTQHDYGVFTLTVSADDKGNTGTGGTLTDTEISTITVRSVNDDPALSVGATALGGTITAATFQGFTEDAAFTAVRGANGTDVLSLADVDLTETGTPAGSPDDLMTVTVSLPSANGLLRVTTLSGLTPDAISGGAADALTSFTSVTLTGSLANLNAVLAALQYQPNADFNTATPATGPNAETLRLVFNDNGNSRPDVNGQAGIAGAGAITRNIPLTVAAVNDAPTLTIATPTFSYAKANDNDALSITGLSIADVDVARGETPTTPPMEVTLDATRAESRLTLGTTTGLTFTAGANGDNSFTIRGTTANLNAALATLQYRPGEDPSTANGAADDSIAVSVNDRGNRGTGGTLTANGSIQIDNVDPVNDAPTVSGPATVTVAEDGSVALSGASLVTVADVDARSNAVQLTLSIPSGSLTLGDTTGLTLQSGANGSGTMVYTGTVTALNTALATLSYAPAANVNKLNSTDAARTLTVTLNDLGFGENNVSTGSGLTGTKTIVMDVTAVNDAPAITAPASLTPNENVANSITGVSVADIDSPDTGYTQLKLTLTATHGNISFTDAALGGATVAGAGGRTVNVTGTQAQVNTLLGTGNLLYTPDSKYSGADSIVLSLTDQGNIGAGTALTDTETISLTVSGVNDPAEVTAPASIAVNEDSSVTIGSSTFRFDDPDVVDNPMILRLAVTKGTLTLATTTGLDFGFTETANPLTGDGGTTNGAGDGTADASMTFKGTQAQINAALNGLVYTPTGNMNGADGLSYTITDLGATGTGGAKQVGGTVTIGITAVNDAPTATGSTTLAAVNEDAAAPAGATVTDLFGGNYSDATDQVTNTGGSSAQPLAGIAIVANTATAAQGIWEYSTDGGSNWTAVATTVSATNATVIPAAALLRFLPQPDFNGTPGHLDAHLSDGTGLSTGTGRNLTGLLGGTNGYSTATVRLTTSITAVNDAPQRTVATTTLAAVLEDTATASIPGATVTSLFSGTFKDTRDTVTVAVGGSGSTANSFAAIAVGANDANPATQGAWQFSTDAGGSWTALPTGIPAGKGFVLAPTDMLRFVPVADYAGTPTGLTAQLIETGGPTTTSTPGNDATYATLPASGGTGRISGTDAHTVTLNTTITAVNDAPVLGAMGGTAAYTENDPAMLVDGSVSLADVDSPDFSGGSLTVAFTANGTAADQLGIRSTGTGAGQISVSGTTVSFAGTAIGTIVQDGSNGGALKVNFTSAAATPLAAKALIEAVTFANSSDAPSDLTRSLTYTLVDGDGTANGGGDTATGTATVTVARVNDAPGFTGLGGTVAFTEDGTPVALDADASFADPELRAGDNWNGATLTVQRSGTASTDDLFAASGTLSFAGGDVKIGATKIGAVTTNTGGVLVLSFDSGATNTLVDQALRQITYANANQAPPASVTLSLNLNDGNPTIDQGSGAALSGSGSVTVAITAVNDAPTRTGTATESLDDVVEDTAAPAGERVDALFQTRFADVDSAAAFAGIAVTANAATAAEGKWQWRTDGAGTWTDIATGVSNATAVVLDADAELRFLPAANYWGAPGALTVRLWDGAGGFTEGAARNITASVGGIGGFSADANTVALGVTVTPLPDTPSVTNSTTAEDTQTTTGLVVTRHATDGAEVTNFRITAITGGRLFLNDGTTEITDGSFITAAQGNAGLKFTPSPNRTAPGSFDVEASSSAGLAGISGGKATATITITAVNDAPVANPDTATHQVGAAAATGNVLTNDTDVDTGTTLTVSAMGIQDGGGGSVGSALAGKYGSVTVNANGTWSYAANAANADVMALEAGQTLQEVVTYTAADGSGGTAASTLTITITGINEAPTVSGGTPLKLAAVAEDAGLPTGAAGSLLRDAVTNIADADTGWLKGIAVTAADTTHGQFHYSTDGGATWQALAAVGADSALLLALDANTRLYFRPTADFNGDAVSALTYRAWDRTSGTAGLTADLTGAGATGGTTAFSTGVGQLTAVVSAANDAPRRSQATVTHGNSAEDSAAPLDSSVSGLFLAAFTDAIDDRTASNGSAADALAGIAVTANGSDARGAWEYQLNGSTTWTAVGARTDATALLLSADDRLRFTPAAHFNGPAPTLTAHLIDASGGAIAGGGTADLSGAGATGGGTRISDAAIRVTLQHTVTAVNDAPVASGLAVLAGIAEDSAQTDIPGDTVSNLFTARFSDATDLVSGGSGANSLAGIAITGNAATAAQGVWQWSSDGGTVWTDVGARTEATALQIRQDHKLRFVPAQDFNGDAPALTVRLIDSSATVTTGTAADLSAGGAKGGTTAVSAATVQLVTAIGSQNDRPLLTLPAAQTVAEDTGLAVPAITIADVDVADAPGDGKVQTTLAVSKGTLTLGTVTGLTFDGAAKNGEATVKVTGSLADVNAALATLTYKGAANFNGDDKVTVLVTDLGNVGTGGARTDTGEIALTVTPVNDAPVLSPASSAIAAVNEDTAAPPGATVASILGTSYTDPDSGDTSADGGPDYVSVRGIAVTGTSGIPGAWQVSYDAGGNWAALPTIGAGDALLLDGAAMLRFLPAASASGTATLTYRAWDQTNGTAAQAGTVVAVGVPGGASPFGAETGTMTATVTGVADTPALSVPGSLSTKEDTPVAMPISASVTDSDGSETLLVQVSGVPSGAVLSAGSTQGGGVWTLPAANLSGLTVTPAKDFSGSFTLTVTAISAEQGGATATSTSSVTVTVDAVADVPALTLAAAQGEEDTAIPLDLQAAIADIDKSETLSLRIAGVPADAKLSAGSRGADGVWTLAAGDLSGLTLSPAKDSDTDLTLTVTATATEPNGSTASTTGTLAVTVKAVADMPALTAPTRLVGKEGAPVALGIASALSDIDTSEALTVTITGMPDDATLSAGTRTAAGWVVAGDQLAGLTVQPAKGSDKDFTLTVTATSTEKAGGAASKVATIDIDLGAVADAPTLEIGGPADGEEDKAISLPVTALLADRDGSETLTLRFDGLPEGTTLSQGARTADGGWEIKAAGTDLSGLTLTPAKDSDADFTLTVTATAEEKDGGKATATGTIAVTVKAVADAPTLAAPETVKAKEGAATALPLTSALVDTDGSETLTLTVAGLPDGAILSAGGRQADGTWTLAASDLSGLTVSPPRGADADFTLTVTATATEKAGGTASTVATVLVDVTATAEAPNLTVSPAQGKEDTAIALTLAADLVDKDGSETLSVTISGVPEGAVLSAGTDLGGGTWELAPDQLADLTVTPAKNSDADFTLTVTATSKEKTGETATVTATLAVTVDAVPDMPTLAAPAALEGNGGVPVPLDLASALADLDTSEELTLLVSGVPSAVSLSAGTRGGDGVWTLKAASLPGLTMTADPTMTPPAGSPPGTAAFTLTVTAISAEKQGGDARTFATIPVTMRLRPFTAPDALTMNEDVRDAIGGIAMVAGTGSVGITLSVGQGTLATGAGAGSASLTLSGTPAEVNAALATLSYQGALNYNGADTLTISSGSSTASVPITVRPVNDAPTVTQPLPARTVQTGQALTAPLPAGLFQDVDLGDVVTVSVSGMPGWMGFDGTALSGTPGALDVGTVTLTVTGTDKAGASASTTLTVSVTTPPPPPPPPPPVVVVTAPAPTPAADAGPATGTAPALIVTAAPAVVAGTPAGGTPAATPATATALPATTLIATGGTATAAPGPSVATATSLATSLPSSDSGAPSTRAATVAPGLSTADGTVSSGGSQAAGGIGNLSGPARQINLMVAGTITDQVLVQNASKAFQVPQNVFRHTNPNEQLVLEAKQSTGEPLPSWLRFDPSTRTFSGTPPAGTEGVLEIAVSARDSSGAEAVTQFRIQVGEDTEPGNERPAQQNRGVRGTPAEGAPGQQNGTAPDGNAPPAEGTPAEGAPAEGAPAERRADAGTETEVARAELGLAAPAEGAPPAPSEGPVVAKASFAAQLRAAGKPGLLAQGRALLDSLLGPDPAPPPAPVAAPGADSRTA